MRGLNGRSKLRWKKISSEKNFFRKKTVFEKKLFSKKVFFENLFNSAAMIVGVKYPKWKPGRAILKSENRLILSILVFELFAI